jgi:hypothetical protein
MNQNQENKPPVTSSMQDQPSKKQKDSTPEKENEKPKFTPKDAYSYTGDFDDNKKPNFTRKDAYTADFSEKDNTRKNS